MLPYSADQSAPSLRKAVVEHKFVLWPEAVVEVLQYLVRSRGVGLIDVQKLMAKQAINMQRGNM